MFICDNWKGKSMGEKDRCIQDNDIQAVVEVRLCELEGKTLRKWLGLVLAECEWQLKARKPFVIIPIRFSGKLIILLSSEMNRIILETPQSTALLPSLQEKLTRHWAFWTGTQPEEKPAANEPHSSYLQPWCYTQWNPDPLLAPSPSAAGSNTGKIFFLSLPLLH